MEHKDVIIVGGGLAGLTAAAILARAGKAIVLIEKGSMLGGRARTHNQGGFRFNLGPHALFKQGIAAQTYRELGLNFSGGEPAIANGFIYAEQTLYPLPFGLSSLVRSRLFRWSEKWEMLKRLKQFSTLAPASQAELSFPNWVAQNIHHPKVAQFLQAIVRLSTYCADTTKLDMELVLEQFQCSAGGVQYLNGGWQTLVDELVRVAQQAGAQILTAQQVKQVNHDHAFRSIELGGGRHMASEHLILAIDPKTVQTLIGLNVETTPIRAACWDLALRRLPIPQRYFVLGLEQPLYYSVHSIYGDLAPKGSAMVQVARYLRSDEILSADQIQCELTTFLDAIQPGWSQEVVHDRFMPNLVVAHDLPRRSSIQSGIQNIHLVGDWVGTKGMLSDRAIASAVKATQAILK